VVVFRSARVDDADAVVDLVDSAYRGDASRAGWTTEADLLGGQRTDRAAVEELIARPRSTLLLAVGDDGLVGCCHLERRDADTEYLGLYAVRPDRQGDGIGSQVMAEAMRRSVGWGARRLRLTVIAQRADLIAWYLRLGFAPTGETEPFPYGDPRFGIPKRPDLVLTVLERDLD
jgi:GNAT superfamily N-acetyltransferase